MILKLKMLTGLANGGDGLSDAALSGIATYSSTKISNPVWSSIVSEAIQKLPNIKNSVTGNQESEDK